MNQPPRSPLPHWVRSLRTRFRQRRITRRQLLRFLIPSTFLFLLALLLWIWPKSDLIAPPATALWVDRHGTYLSESDAETLGYWDTDSQQAARVASALIAIEDRRFHSHHGVDLRALARAFRNNLQGGPRQGASTIAMQVARIQSGSHQRHYLQKLQELLVAQLLVLRHGRQAVLNHYLKIVPQGNRISGVAYAARRYFQKPLVDLSWSEAALLAALPKAPGRMNLYRPSGRAAAIQRARRILDLLHSQGVLQSDERDRALAQLDELKIPPREVRPYNAYHAILRLQNQPASPTYHGPLVTTLDLRLQKRIETAAVEAIRGLRRHDAGNIAAVLLDRRHGDVLAYLGSEYFDDPLHAGAIDFANTPRSSGSALKPFIYAMGLETGTFRPNSILDDLPLHLTYEGAHYTASNYDRHYLGPMLYRRALATSRNIPALTVLRQTGLGQTHRRLLDLGLGDPALPPSHYGLGLAIGGMYVTLEDLVSAYGCLANDGRTYQPRWILNGPGGPGQTHHFPQAVARQIIQFLADPSARLPIFPHLDFPFPVAIKTGTSQGFRDGWAVAVTDRYILGMWVGRPDNGSMQQIGGAEVARIVRQLIFQLHPEQVRSINERPFPDPQDYQAVEICALSGERADERCNEATRELFAPGQEPQHTNSVHRRFFIDSQTGTLAQPDTPPEQITAKNYVVLPPRYTTWGSLHGYGPPPDQNTPLRNAHIQVQAPVAGGRFRIDPDLPRQFQTLALTATVEPQIPEVEWTIDGKPFQRAPYPYQVRWPMEPGEHAIQVRFPNADIISQPITITVN